MSSLNIYTLLLGIRGLSNQITVRGLSDRLGISYSTLARCKNGVWPRSITLSAMRETLEDCRKQLFGGDGGALAAELLLQLRGQSVDTQALEDVLAGKGYDVFVSELLSRASHPEDVYQTETSAQTSARAAAEMPTQVPTESVVEPAAEALAKKPTEEAARTAPGTPAETSAQAPTRVPAETSPQALPAEDIMAGQPAVADQYALSGSQVVLGPRPTTVAHPTADTPPTDATPVAPTREAQGPRPFPYDLILVLPVVVILALGLFDMPLGICVAWAAEHRLAFLALSVAIALAPALAGICVDAPLAWRRYHREHPDAAFTLAAFSRIAKYGSPDGIVAGAGRFDLTPAYLVHQPLCNLAGAFTYAALFFTLLSLPGFPDFFLGHEWLEFLKVGIVVAFAIAYAHVREQAGKQRPSDPLLETGDNPDNYLPTRVHVWANTIHLVWTLSLLVVLLLSLLAYSFAMFRRLPSPGLLLWPYLHGMAFFALTYQTPYAIRTQITGAGAFLPGVLATSIGFVGLSLVCYQLSLGGLALCGACLACSVAAIVWFRRRAHGPARDWLRRYQRARAYSIGIAITIFSLFVIGLLTQAFA